MTVGSALLSFALLAALLTILPGIDTALILRSALTQSRRHAYATAAGIITGTFAWGAAAAVGAAALLAASELAFTILKLVGAAYLVYLGISMIVASFRRAHVSGPPPAGSDESRSDLAAVRAGMDASAKPAGSLWAAFGRGALTDLLNPKVGVFYIALIPQFIPAGVVPVAMGLALAAVHVVESIIWFSALIFATQVARRWLQSPRVSRWIDRITGGVVIGFGAVLAAESAP